MSMDEAPKNACTRPIRTPTAIRSVLAAAKRRRSWASRTNARITRIPVICSRITRLTASS